MEPDFAPKLRPNATQRPRRKRAGELRVALLKFTLHLRREFAEEIEADPQTFKRRAIWFLKRGLPPGPGRPYDAAVTRAVKMRAQGNSWRAIYTECLPACLNADSRQLAQSRLRSAVRARRRRLARRKPLESLSLNR